MPVRRQPHRNYSKTTPRTAGRNSFNGAKKESWEDEYAISFYEVDTKNEAFLPVLWSFMQETAWHHAEHLRLGYSDLMEHQYFWVLSRLSIQMEEYPRWGDRIKVKTWLTGTGRLFALRQFSIADFKGKVIGTAKSAWLVLDLKSRKPQKIEPVFKHIEHLFDGLPPAEEPSKIPGPCCILRWKSLIRFGTAILTCIIT